MIAPQVEVVEIIRRERPYTLRMPFRFGVTTATHGRQAMIGVRIRLTDGREGFGYAAEALGAKWFDKNPALTDADNHHQLRRAPSNWPAMPIWLPARRRLLICSPTIIAPISRLVASRTAPRVASYGPALLDRAVLDALCRLLGASFLPERSRAICPASGPTPSCRNSTASISTPISRALSLPPASTCATRLAWSIH
ncbi:hypothetical protein [Devosia ginsengisoli]|uniref:hypothetical protein n=1 Tax=Devosia ginsengisoli TaxID=400770 RepID=UPI0026EC66BA|nr:hypothetical protein [Devosia ginsengisoli]MCR6669799.1 hypothetical protein [Devosia ginsengisoli]